MASGDAGARKRRRLSRSGEFDRVYREGTSYANRYLVLYSFPRRVEGDGDGPELALRLGVSAGRKVGGAVARNRAKRALREAFWGLAEQLPPGHDFVLVARPAINELIEREGGTGVAGCVREALAEAHGGERFA
jgi:ribonuclease P protein component